VRRFLEALRSYGGADGILTLNELLPYLDKVKPEPRYGDFGTNEAGSDFLFLAKAPPRDFGTLTVLPTPPDAQVYVDGKYVAGGSVERYELPPGQHVVRVFKDAYDEARRDVIIELGKDTHVAMTLESARGYLTLEGVPADAEVHLDGSRIGSGAIVRYGLSPGAHSLEVKPPQSAQRASREVVINRQVESKVVARFGVFTVYPALRSAIVPGLGQLVNGSTTKGVFFLVGTLGIGAYAATTHLDYTKKVDSYNLVVDAYNRAGTVEEATKKRREMQQQYSAVEDANKLRTITLGGAAGLYILNVLDGLLFESTRTELVLLTQRWGVEVHPTLFSSTGCPGVELKFTLR
jgi:hypothetical protein